MARWRYAASDLSNGSAAGLPIFLTLHVSPTLALLLYAAHGGALIVLGNVELPVWISLIMISGIALSAWQVHRRLHGARRIVGLALLDDGVLEYLRSNEETGEARIHPQSTVTPLLTVLLLRQGKRLESLVMLPDSLPEESFRRLRLWLRLRIAFG